MDRNAGSGQVCFFCHRTGVPNREAGWSEFQFSPFGKSAETTEIYTTSSAICPECSRLVDKALKDVKDSVL